MPSFEKNNWKNSSTSTWRRDETVSSMKLNIQVPGYSKDTKTIWAGYFKAVNRIEWIKNGLLKPQVSPHRKINFREECSTLCWWSCWVDDLKTRLYHNSLYSTSQMLRDSNINIVEITSRITANSTRENFLRSHVSNSLKLSIPHCFNMCRRWHLMIPTYVQIS